jgi:hypothetical protein
MHYIKFHIKTLKIAPTYYDLKIILRELHCSLFAEDDLRIETCRSDFKCFNVKFYIVHLLVNNQSDCTKGTVQQ